MAVMFTSNSLNNNSIEAQSSATVSTTLLREFFILFRDEPKSKSVMLGNHSAEFLTLEDAIYVFHLNYNFRINFNKYGFYA